MFRCNMLTGGVTYRHLHISMVDEGPSTWSLQDIVQEVLQSSVKSISLGGFLPSRNTTALPSRTLLPTWRQVSGRTDGTQVEAFKLFISHLFSSEYLSDD